MTIDAEKKLTEGLLRSVLISSPGGVPLHKLAREFKEIAMSDLPLAKLGYSTVEDYIRSIPHCAFITSNKDGIIVVKGIATDETKHVAKLVSGQRKPKKRKPSKYSFGRSRGGLLGSRPLQVIRRQPVRSYPVPEFKPAGMRFSGSSSRPEMHFSVGSSKPEMRFNIGSSKPEMRFNIGNSKPGLFQAQRPAFVPPLAIAPTPNTFKFTQKSSPPVKLSNTAAFTLPSKPISEPKITTQQPRNTPIVGQSSKYELPPRMKRLQQSQNMQENNKNNGNTNNSTEINSTTSQTAEVDVNKLKEDDLRFTIINNKFEAKCKVLKNNVIAILEKYPNGLWGDLLKKFYKDKFGEAPENILQLVKENMVDKIDIHSASQGKVILYLKKEPEPPPKQEDKRVVEFQEKNNEQNIKGDLRVVLRSDGGQLSGSTREVIQTPKEEPLSIPEQDIPEIGETIEAYICHIDGINRFFIHRADSGIFEFSEKIQTYYEKHREEDALRSPKIGSLCCACYQNQWYRGQIILVKKPDVKLYNPALKFNGGKEENQENNSFDCKVQYIDFGNLESVRSDKMRKLKPEFCSLQAQALQCNLHGVSLDKPDLSEEAKEYFKEKTEEKLLKVTIKGLKDNIIDVELCTTDGESISESLVDRELAVFEGKRRSPMKNDSSPTMPVTTEGKEEDFAPSQTSSILKRLASLSLEEEDIEVTNVDVPDDKYLDVLVSAVNSFNEISVILLGNEYRGRLMVLHEAMELFYDNEPNEELESVEPDKVYAAFYEDAWHRVRILGVNDDEVEIDLVDRGDQSTTKFSDLRKLPSQFKRLPAQAMSLTLAHLPDSDNSDFIQELSDMVLGKSCVAEVVDGPDELTTIELYDTSGEKDININKEIIAKLNLSEEQNYEQVLPKVGEQGDAYVAHITDTGVFYIVFPGPGINRLDELMEELANYFAKGSKAADFVKKPEVDKVCCTKWNEDDLMYRVLITCVMPDEQMAEVEFVDYGNRDMVSFRSLKEIPQHLKDLITLPAQVVKCSLADDREELKPMWKYGLSSRLTAELKTQTVVVKVDEEATEDKLTTVSIFKPDPSEGLVPLLAFDEISEDISGPNRKRSSGSFASSGSDTSASEVKQKIEQSSEEIKPSQPSCKLPALNSQLSLASMDSDGTSERDRRQGVSTGGVFLRNASVPPLEIKASWVTVHVTSVQSPSKFYFQIQDSTSQLISDLFENMNEFYKDNEDCFEDCCAGDACAVFVPEDDMWYRCIVHSRVEIDEEVQVCVFFVDFGNLTFVSISDVRPLDGQFLAFPFQAVHASLAGISPAEHKKWPKKSQNRFAELTVGKLFRAQIHGPYTIYPALHCFPAEKSFNITLYDANGEVDVCVNELLVAENLAVRQV